MCQVGCNRVPIFLPAGPPSSLPSAIKLCSNRQHPGWKAVHVWPWGSDGWWDRDSGGGGGVGGAVTYCRFRCYSCGGTVIISPLLLNSVILSYISDARGQEILQFINRSTLRKGDYRMAYTLTSLFGLNYFFSAVLPRLCLCPVGPYRVLSSSSQSAHTSCDLHCMSICLCVLWFPWRRGWGGGLEGITFPISFDRSLSDCSQKKEVVSQHQCLSSSNFWRLYMKSSY